MWPPQIIWWYLSKKRKSYKCPGEVHFLYIDDASNSSKTLWLGNRINRTGDTMKFPYQPHPQVLHYLPDFTQPALTLSTNHCQLRPHNPNKILLWWPTKRSLYHWMPHLLFLYQLFFPTKSRVHWTFSTTLTKDGINNPFHLSQNWTLLHKLKSNERRLFPQQCILHWLMKRHWSGCERPPPCNAKQADASIARYHIECNPGISQKVFPTPPCSQNMRAILNLF